MTLPVTVTGRIERLAVRVDVGDVALRAIRNRATEEAREGDRARRLPGLGGLFKRKPR